ncbi:tetratricopeptide repeat-containing sensor histidine kinase [Spongiimicrobium salis]|uniref:tetratricopeptide repeat-containing sensor histidine kinase n=1 Tax=Spongiimicrobium salis TaxID=1667022 RepID=UPI00374D4573
MYFVPTKKKGKWESYFFLFFLVFFHWGTAQDVPDSFEKITDSLLGISPRGYISIDRVMRPYQRDTLLMRYFAKTATQRNYLEGQSYALNQLGRKYRNTSQYEQAISLHEQALEIANRAQNTELTVFSLNMIGVVYRRKSTIRAAMDYSQQALELAESVPNPSKSLKRSINVSLNSIGNLYQTLNQYDDAITYYTKSMKLEAELGNTLGLAINHQNIGECLEAKGFLEDALKSYQTSMRYNEEIDSDMGRVICQNSIAKIYIKQRKLTEALFLLQSALQKATDLKDSFLISRIYSNLGWAQMIGENYELAEENMLKGLEEAQKHNLQEISVEAYTLLSNLFEAKEDYKKSLFYTHKATALEKVISNEGNVSYVNDIKYRYQSKKQSDHIQQLQLEMRKGESRYLITIIALVLLAGILYILYRQYQLKNDKKLLTLEQSMLRSQMNPHFLFNSLNSIKLYIINNEKKNAVHYLNKFSKLIRKILEASSLKEIPLAEELETVELYMNIENIRFSNEINFQIEIDNTIDTHTAKIPSLVLQPFLENALWHGLSSKEGEKNIWLKAGKTEENFIHISIIDDGIGRKAAEKIKRARVLKRKSVGIDITKERLANFSKDYQNTFSIDIIDLYNEDGSASGTQVTLYIPAI